MPHDWDRWVRWGLAVTAAGTLSVGSGIALAHFTVQGTSQFYMPRSASDADGDIASDSGAADSGSAMAANRRANLWQLLPNAGKITRVDGVDHAPAERFDSSPN